MEQSQTIKSYFRLCVILSMVDNYNILSSYFNRNQKKEQAKSRNRKGQFGNIKQLRLQHMKHGYGLRH